MSISTRLCLVLVMVVWGGAATVATLSAQTCIGDVTVASQADADAFTCGTVTGTLRISGGSITHLDGLSELTSVTVNLFITNNAALRTLAGLAALTAVEGTLAITDNAALTQFCGLFPLLAGDGVDGDVTLNNNGIVITETAILAAGPCVSP
jgi:hypothetical protein